MFMKASIVLFENMKAAGRYHKLCQQFLVQFTVKIHV